MKNPEKKVQQKSKKDLIEIAKKNGFFKKEGVKQIYARGNGHFYYTKPPRFIDDFDTFLITREDIEGKSVSKALTKKKDKLSPKGEE